MEELSINDSCICLTFFYFNRVITLPWKFWSYLNLKVSHFQGFAWVCILLGYLNYVRQLFEILWKGTFLRKMLNVGNCMMCSSEKFWNCLMLFLVLFCRLQEARLKLLQKILKEREEHHSEITSKRLDKVWSKKQKEKEKKVAWIRKEHIKGEDKKGCSIFVEFWPV